MCSLAAERSSTWLMMDSWETFQDYQKTTAVLNHFDHEINTTLKGVHLNAKQNERRNVRVMLLAGSDLIESMSDPGLWADSDVTAFHVLPKHD